MMSEYDINDLHLFLFLVGGHINPAVSLALAVVGRFPWHKVPIYMLAQYCGAFCASFFVYIIYMGIQTTL